MNKVKKVYQFKLDQILPNKKFVDSKFTEVGWEAVYKISNTSEYNHIHFYLIYSDIDNGGKNNPHFEFSIIDGDRGLDTYKLSSDQKYIYKRCIKLLKDLGFKPDKYSNVVTDITGKEKIKTDFVLERKSSIKNLEEFKDIVNDFLQALNENMREE